MQTIVLPTEDDFRRWIREEMAEYFRQHPPLASGAEAPGHEGFLERKQVADMFHISLVTLHEWVKKGLPSHKQGGRVYFLRSEVFEYVRNSKSRSVGAVYAKMDQLAKAS